MRPITNMIGYNTHINIPAQPSPSIIAYVIPMANDKNGPMATIFAIPHMMNLRFLDCPIVKTRARDAPKKAIKIAIKIAKKVTPHLGKPTYFDVV